MSQPIELSVIAPCYNEEGNVTQLVSRLLGVFVRRRIAGEVVLVDDGSSDATPAILDRLAAEHPEVVVVHHGRNRGLSPAWDTGLDASRGRYVCFIDADLQNPPEEVWRLYREIVQSRADMVQGVRSAIGRLKDDRYVTSRVLNVMLNVGFGMSATDNKSGFVIALRETMIDTLRRRFSYRYSHVFITVAAHAKGYTIREVETLFQNRHAGASFIKQWPIKLVFDVCVDMAKALVEFRFSKEHVDALEQALQSTRTDESGIWSRLRVEAFTLSLSLRRPLITRRVVRLYRGLMRTQWMSAAEIRQLQESRLRRLIRHAYHHVPYYRELFDRLHVRPESTQTIADLRSLPLLSRHDVSENLYFDLFADNHQKHGMQKVASRGCAAGESSELYVDGLQLEMAVANLLRTVAWRGGATTLPQRVDDVFGKYAGGELDGISDECATGGARHIAAESYIVEVIRAGGPARCGEIGEMVVTDLNSFSVPLIRYRTGQLVVAASDATCGCGRGLPRIASIPQPLSADAQSQEFASSAARDLLVGSS